jgi:Leucine-rich repeat (LRR) protein
MKSQSKYSSELDAMLHFNLVDACFKAYLFPHIHSFCVKYRCASLKTLDLSKNKLTKLGKISQLKELKSFNCDENALTSNELAPLSNLNKLQSLSLGKNRLENPTNHQFPSLPSTMKQLKLQGNSLSSIPRAICHPNMKLLEKLDLSFNNLAEVPAEICNLGEPQLFLSG